MDIGSCVFFKKTAKASRQSSRIGFDSHLGNGTLNSSDQPPRAFSAPAFTSSQPPPRIRKAGTVHFGEPQELTKTRSPPRTALPELVNGEQPSKLHSSVMSPSASKATSLQPSSAKSRSSSAASTFKTHVTSWQRK